VRVRTVPKSERKGILSSSVTNEGEDVCGHVMMGGLGRGYQVVCCIYTGVLWYLGKH